MADTPDRRLTVKGQPPVPNGHTWVQTERKAHEAWGSLAVKKPRAAALLHHLVALMGQGNVVVVSMGDLGKILGCAERTVYRAAADLEEGNWVQRLKVSGNVYGFAINTEVAWAGFRGAKYEGAVFSAAVVAPRAEMEAARKPKLRRVPLLFPPEERALPTETGGDPGAQTELPGLESSVEIPPHARPRPCGDPELDQMDFNGKTERERRQS